MSSEVGLGFDGLICSEEINAKLDVHYKEVSEGIYRARACLFDSESSAIDSVQNGTLRTLFLDDNFLHSNVKTNNVFAVGLFSHGEWMRYETSTLLSRMLEKCDSADSF